MNKQSRLFVGVCILIGTIAVTWYFLSGWSVRTPVSSGTVPEVSVGRLVPEGLREYRNTAYRFSLLYPQELEVKEYLEGGNAITITFQDTKKEDGFQLFIMPYQELQVSEERFKQDLPSGVRTNMSDVSIDGATGATFYSVNQTLGETREVWFIHDGFLFEVTTLKPLEAWLDAILQTWEFL